ncbi:MAG: hydrogenase expression/formation protein HypE [Ignavibacteria bacterium]|nr:hydrogenase expression/formation protein HypE [Ignavibacteria bacterium]
MEFQLSCPIPKSEYEKVLLAHGGGGTLTHQLISKMFLNQFGNEYLNELHDGAIFEISGNKFAFTTDSYVVNPIFFPGGNIGELAINGTVNDLAVCGAKPLFISAGFIIEEGLEIEELWQIVLSMKKAADEAGVMIVTGDTKVVEKGKGDKIFINTSGIGLVYEGLEISPKKVKSGDVIIINGRIAEHGIAIMSEREGLEFETKIKSDTAPLNGLVEDILKVSNKISVMRDPTRGGLASALNEIASSANVKIEIYEKEIPVSEEVMGACEILGLDPLYIANEGKILVFVDESDAEKVLDAMKKNPHGKESRIIGKVIEEGLSLVTMKTLIGSTRIVDMISGEQLPRIC